MLGFASALARFELDNVHMLSTALILGGILILANGVFVANEFAIVKLRSTQVEALKKKRLPGANIVESMVQNLNGYLSASQLGITVTSITLGKLAEPAIEHQLEESLGHQVPSWAAASLAIFIITAVHMQVGEMIPKSLALVYPSRIALLAAYPMRIFYGLSFPLVWVFNILSSWAIRLMGLTPPEHHESSHSPEELKLLLQQTLSPDRADLLTKALSLPAKTAEDMMVPRSEVDWMDTHLSLEENLQRAAESGRTRFPLCNRELDDCVGIVDLKDVLWAMQQGQSADLQALASSPVFFPETLSGERLLKEFRERRVQMALVVDEYGGASGIITPADVVSAVLGELDEDDDEPEVRLLPGGQFEVDGGATLEELYGSLHVEIEDTEMHTVGGVLMEALGRMPKAGDIVVAHALIFRVLKVEGPRIERVRVSYQEQPADAAEQEAQQSQQ